MVTRHKWTDRQEHDVSSILLSLKSFGKSQHTSVLHLNSVKIKAFLDAALNASNLDINVAVSIHLLEELYPDNVIDLDTYNRSL